MIKSFWIVGIILALSAFGVKVGLGAAALSYAGTITPKKRLLSLSGIFLLYLLLFFGLYTLTRYFPLLNYFGHFSRILHYGMLIHIFIALGLLVWGIRLLSSVLLPTTDHRLPTTDYRGALLLILPCPVCATVILITLSLAYSLFSSSLFITTGFLFGIFLTVSLLTILLTFPFRRQIRRANSSFLGMVMVVVALYFFLTVLIAPIYQETIDIYYLASRITGDPLLDLKSCLVISAIIISLFSIGFFKNLPRKDRKIEY